MTLNLQDYEPALMQGAVVNTTDDINIANGKILVGNASGVAAEVTPSGDVTMTNAGVTAIGADKVLSAMVDGGLLKTVTVPISAAQIIAMYTTPVLVLAGVTAKKILVQSVAFSITRTATAFTGGGVVNVQYDSTANGAGTKTHADIAATVVTGSAGTTHTYRIPLVLSDVADADLVAKGLYLSNATQVFAAGTGTASVTVRYCLL